MSECHVLTYFAENQRVIKGERKREGFQRVSVRICSNLQHNLIRCERQGVETRYEYDYKVQQQNNRELGLEQVAIL